MAYKPLPAAYFRRKAWDTVAFQGIPLFRAHAMVLDDYLRHGGHLIVNSGDRRDGIAQKFHKQSQLELYSGWVQRKPGFMPANPPGFSSHELRSDGHPIYGVRRGDRIPDFMLGIDAVDHPGGDAARFVAWANAHGYHAIRPYNTDSERHHWMLTKSPVTNARARRLVKRPKRQPKVSGIDDNGVRFIAQWEGFRAQPYNDLAGHATVGFGHLIHMGKVTAGDRAKWGTLTRAEGLSLLAKDAAVYSSAVRSVAPWLNQNQHNAITSAVFNLGPGILAPTRSLGLALRAHKGVTKALRLYDRAGVPPRPVKGLTLRRTAEAALYSRK